MQAKKKAAKSKTDHEKLRGTWRVVKEVWHGEKQSHGQESKWWIGKDRMVMKPALLSPTETPEPRQVASYHFWGDNDDKEAAPKQYQHDTSDC